MIACHVATGVCDRGSADVPVQASCTSSAGWRPQRARSFIRGGTPKQGWAVGNRTLAQFQQCPMVFSSVVSYQGRPAVGNRCAARFVCRLAIITLCQFRGAGWRRLCGPWAERCSRASLLLRDLVEQGFASFFMLSRQLLCSLPPWTHWLLKFASGLGLWNIMAGAYAAQAMEGEGAWSAATSLQVIAASRVREWRQKHRVQKDADFAFYFTSYEQAVRQAGHHVADAWTVARAEQEGCLFSAASAAVEGPAPSDRPPLPRPTSAVRGRQGRLAPAEPDGGDLRERRSKLVTVLLQLGAFRPAGPLSDVLRREWERTVERTASRFVDRADRSTIDGVLRTWRELSAWQRARSRPAVPELVDVDSFLADGTPAPTRALACLRWLVKKAKLDLDLSDVDVTARKPGQAPQPRGQAPCVGPDMLGFLEEKIELAHSFGDEKWSALLGSWLVAAGCLRYRHLQVAEPRRVSTTAFHGHCRRGKQAHLRISGFDFAICAHFSSGWSWTEAWLRDWKALSPAAKKGAGLCFNRAGKPWAISEINLCVQEAFRDVLQEPADMTTYSWRRLLPTVGQLLRLTPQEQLALGDWASSNPEGNQMPLHYSSARYTTSLRCKALSLAAAWEVRGFEDWSAVTDTELDRIRGAVQNRVDQVIVGDRATVFQAPVTAETLHRSLALTRTWRLRAAKTRSRSSQEQVERMPPTLNGKVLTAFLKNGQSLCASFQLGKCKLAETDCAGSHRCAVALRSGRACGGNHAAQVCFDKRALLAQAAKEPGPTGPTVLPQRRPAPAEPSAPPPKRARLPLAETVPSEAASSSSTTAKATPKAASRAAPKVALKAAPKVKARPKAVSASADSGRDPVVLRAASPVASGGTGGGSEDTAGESWHNYFDRLATAGEAPTVIWQSGSGGRLFLSGLPTAATAQYFPKVSLQVTCFDKSPEQRGGVLLPGALGIRLDFKSRDREDAFHHAFDLTKNSLWSGEHVLFHCMAGRHRAATYAGLTRSLLAFESLPDALQHLKSVRNVEPEKVLSERGVGDFVHRMRRTISLGRAAPVPTAYLATATSNVHVASNDIPLCKHNQSTSKALRLKDAWSTADREEAVGWGIRFCKACLRLSPASWHPR